MLTAAEIRERAPFIALEKEWNALVDAIQGPANERHEFFRVFIDHFIGDWKRVRIWIARDERGRLKGVLPLVIKPALFYGLPVRRLEALVNYHFTRFDLIADDPVTVSQAFLDALAVQSGWDLLNLSFIPSPGRLDSWDDSAAARGFPVLRYSTLRSPYLPLPDSMDEVYARLNPKFRANLRRRLENLKEQGPVELEKFSSGPELDELWKAGMDIESSGWKGAEGTAIARTPELQGFYSDLARAASQQGYLRFYFLKAGGQRIAFQYGLASHGRYLFLKPGYDERFKTYSPGHLLVEEVLRDCIAGGLKEFDFLGESMPWKQEWTAHERSHASITLFKNSLYGRFLEKIQSQGVPRIKKLLKPHTP